MLFQLFHLLFQEVLMLFKDVKSLSCSGISLTAQAGKMKHLGNRHPGCS